MRSVLLSTAAWPNVHYLYYVANYPRILIEQHETYPRQTYRNRYEILSASGVLPLTIPVIRSGNHTKTRDVRIDYTSDWQTRHWRALTSAYRKSPYFEFFEDEIRSLFDRRYDFLLEYNLAQLRLVLGMLKMNPEILLTTHYEKTTANAADARNITIVRNKPDTDSAESRILSKNYYQTFREKFAFAPNLSCLDILFNIGLNTKEHLQHINAS